MSRSAVFLAVLLVLPVRAQQPATDIPLSDSAQYDRLTRQLANAGVTAQTHAQFFERLERARLAPRSAKAPKVTSLVVALATDDGDSYTATAMSTVAGGFDYALLTLQLYNQNDRPIGKAVSVERFEGALATISAQGIAGAEPGTKFVRALLTAFVEPTGQPGQAQIAFAESIVVPQSLRNDAPTPKEGEDVIRVCIGRRNPTCTYSSRLLTRLPIEGTVTFSKPIDKIRYGNNGDPTNASVALELVDVTNGGTCKSVTPHQFFKKFSSVKGNTLHWSIASASFGTCYPTDARFVLAIGVHVENEPAFVTIGGDGVAASRTSIPLPTVSVLRERKEKE